jgi:hypothetical protein
MANRPEGIDALWETSFWPCLSLHEHHLPRGVTVGSIKSIFLSAYFAAWLAAFIVGPLILMHGYRQWWLVTLYAVMAVAATAGSINHYRIGRRNRKS